MATPCRHTFSGALLAFLVGALVGIGWVPTAETQARATDSTFVVPDACPQGWPLLHGGLGAEADGNASVLVGGNLSARGSAAGAEGVVVVRGDATFARDEPGPYEVGTTAIGSQVGAPAGSDMLVVGGNLSAAAGTHLDVGSGLGGDVAVGGLVAAGTDADLHGGRLDSGVRAVLTPYAALLDSLTGKSLAYAGLAPTGTAELTEATLTLIGDGTSQTQVFSLDGAALGASPEGPGRSLQLLGVPAGAQVVVNLTGPVVDLDLDSVLSVDGAVLDAAVDPVFVDLATRLVWNVPSAATVDVGGAAQLPGSLLVGSAPSTTTLSGAGTNGRVLVAGDLVHTGSGRLHAYPLLADPDLGCKAAVAHLGTVRIDVRLQDPGDVVDPDRVFQGSLQCTLDGVDVTPAGSDTWRARAGTGGRIVTDQVPVGAVCEVAERLDAPPAEGWKWADPQLEPGQVQVAKRDPRTVKVTNRALELPQPPAVYVPPGPTAPGPSSDPTPSAPTTPELPPPPPVDPEPEPEPTPSSLPEPTNRPEPSAAPSSQPTPEPVEPTTPTADAEPGPSSDPPRSTTAGPITTTAPLTLRGAFVWGPLLLLSVLTMLLRVRRRPRYVRVH